MLAGRGRQGIYRLALIAGVFTGAVRVDAIDGATFEDSDVVVPQSVMPGLVVELRVAAVVQVLYRPARLYTGPFSC